MDGEALFAGHPELKPVQIGTIIYPPLARQTRTSGTVLAHVSVASDGSVSAVQIASGNPLLRPSVEDGVKKWKFASGSESSFDLTCDFIIDLNALGFLRGGLYIVKPLHLRIATTAPIVNPIAANTQKQE